MPIRINLKEIFPSDPQEINVEKVNFNFNKLLELGIGTPGPIGLTGPQGPAGPIGLTGPQGIRGATWWVDSGIPSTHTFAGLLDGDLYLDNTSFDVWRWDSTTSTWTLEVGISTIINTYLAANGSPFVKDLKSLPSLNKDGRFITFSKRDDTNDIVRGIASASMNNSLFLTNFDETQAFPQPLIQWPPNVKSLYNSIVSIFTNHSDGLVSTASDLGRYHLELGSLYTDNINTILSEVKHNLKIKFIKDYIELPRTAGLWNKWINTAQFSVSIDETKLANDIDQNGIFNFITPKFNDTLNPAPPIQDELYTRIGPWESHAEIHNLANVVADGISFELLYSSLSANIGIAQTYDSNGISTRLDTKDLFMLDSNNNVVGTLINDNTYIIGDTNVIGKVSIGDIDPTSYLTVSGNASIGAGYNAILAPTNGAIIEGDLGIGTSSPAAKVHIVSGNQHIQLATGTNTSGYTLSVGVNDDGVNFSTNTTSRGFVFIGGNALPALSGTTQTKGLRLSDDMGISVLDMGIDSGNGQAWLQSTVSGNLAYGGNLLLNPNAGTVGIGTTSPDTASSLHINGKIKIGGGSPANNRVLTSDATGLSRWEDLSSLGLSGIGTTNHIPIWTGPTTLGDSAITQTGGYVRINSNGLTVDNKTYLYDTLNVTNKTTIDDDLQVNNNTVINGSTTMKGGIFSNFTNTYHYGGVDYESGGTAGHVLLSGRSIYPSNGSCDFNWSKVGSVITVHGTWVTSTGTDTFFLPVQASGGASISHVVGVCSRTNGDAANVGPISVYGPYGSPVLDSAKLYTDGSTAFSGTYYMSFSYIIE